MEVSRKTHKSLKEMLKQHDMPHKTTYLALAVTKATVVLSGITTFEIKTPATRLSAASSLHASCSMGTVPASR